MCFCGRDPPGTAAVGGEDGGEDQATPKKTRAAVHDGKLGKPKIRMGLISPKTKLARAKEAAARAKAALVQACQYKTDSF